MKNILLIALGSVLITGCAFQNAAPENVAPEEIQKKIETFRSSYAVNVEPVDIEIGSFDAPLSEIRVTVEQRLEDWMERPSSVPTFEMVKPQTPAINPPATITKGEFETTLQFESRVQDEQLLYDEYVQAQLGGYQDSVKEYNEAVASHNRAVELEQFLRRDTISRLRWDFINEELQNTLGSPYLESALYDADAEQFVADIVSRNVNFKYTVAIDIPLEVAPSFKSRLADVKPLLSFTLDDIAGLNVSDVVVEFDGNRYPAAIIDSLLLKGNRQRTLKVSEDFSVLPLDPVKVNIDGKVK